MMKPCNLPENKENQALVVDDNLICNKLMKAILERIWYTVTSVFNWEDAIEAFRAWNYTVVIMDLHLPKKSWLECAREIKEIADVQTKIIWVTASLLKNIPYFEFDKMISKPITINEIALALNK